MSKNLPASDQGFSRVDKFLASVTAKPACRGNLIFALDATASREPTWDMAVHLQAQMFAEVATIGSLDIKLVYFRGAHRADAECKASGWTSNPTQLASFMTGIKCRAGLTQIRRVLDHTLRESGQRKIGALVYIGDQCEERRDLLIPKARRLAEHSVPVFLFQEGHVPEAESVFREIAKITHGAYSPFDSGSAKQLSELLRAVAAFATGGVGALEHQGTKAARLLLIQVR
jgi:hypothetical protein